MVQETVPAAKRRLNVHHKALRQARIFTRLREGWPYAEIAREEGLTSRRIRQIVSETLQKRVVDPPADHAMLQLARLEPALRLAAGAVASGDIKAIRYYLKLLDRLDRYQPTAATPQAYDDAARASLYAKMGRLAARSKPRTIKEAPRNRSAGRREGAKDERGKPTPNAEPWSQSG